MRIASAVLAAFLLNARREPTRVEFTPRVIRLKYGWAIFTIVCALWCPALATSQVCLAVPGDITDDGLTNVVDVQCSIRVSLSVLGGEAALPTCLQVGLAGADLDCDGAVNVTDVILAIRLALSLGLGEIIDADGDGCADACACLPDPDQCNDGNPCTYSHCIPSIGCVHSPITGPCDDGDDCTLNNHCANGVCVGQHICDDGNPCTFDYCLNGFDCYYLPTPGPCEDGDPCTTASTCANGHCVGGIVCDDGNPCTDGFCLPGWGCFPAYNTEWCNNGDPCTALAICTFGECVGLIATNCHDGNPCTNDSCTPGVGCVFAPNTAPCDDGDPCTLGGSCAAGSCGGGSIIGCDDGNPCTDDFCVAGLGCQFVPTQTPCSDNNPCTVGDTCAAGACAPGPQLDCGQAEGSCAGPYCDLAYGCVASPIGTIIEAEAYDSASGVIQVAACGPNGWSGGVHVWGPGDVTYSVHVPASRLALWLRYASGIHHTVIASIPGLPSQTADIVPTAGGDCGPAAVWAKIGEFEPTSAAIVELKLGSAATLPHVDALAFLQPDATPPAAWSAGNRFGPSDALLPASTPAPPSTLCPIGAPCSPYGVCTYSMCLPPAADVNCAPASECEATAALGILVEAEAFTNADTTVGEGAWCGPEGWSGGVHIGGIGAVEYQVQLPGGIWSLWARYAQSENRWADVYFNEELVAHGAMLQQSDGFTFCGTGSSWTHVVDLQVIRSGHQTLRLQSGGPFPFPHIDVFAFLPQGAAPAASFGAGVAFGPADGFAPRTPCALPETCPGEHLCMFGLCMGNPLCDDNNPCTTDTCGTEGICVFSPLTGPACDDANACTTLDACSAGVCAGSEVFCADGDPCTADSCSPASGCVFPPTSGPACHDGDACTHADTCVAGACVGTPVECSDGEPCTIDACNSATGCQYSEIICPPDGPCLPGSCVGGACVTIPVVASCCEPQGAAGCGAAPCESCVCSIMPSCCGPEGQWSEACADLASTACAPSCRCDQKNCSDTNACTTADTCQGAAGCVGEPLACNDGDECTADSCNPATGCVFEPINEGAVCTDGNVCKVQKCQGGQCTTMASITRNCCLNNPKIDGFCSVSSTCSQCIFQSGNACALTGGDPLSAICQSYLATNCTSACGCQLIACEDGDSCTYGEMCNFGTCQPASATPCDDGNPCTLDVCQEGVGCVHLPNDGAPCNDGDPCTGPDTCGGGQCAGPPSSGAPCDDGNPCTYPDTCLLGGCQGPDQAQAVCGAGSCKIAACVPEFISPTITIPKCFYTDRNCDDGKPWTANQCVEGVGCVNDTLLPTWSCQGICGGISSNLKCSCQNNCSQPGQMPCCPDACERCCACGGEGSACVNFTWCGNTPPAPNKCGCDEACNTRGDCCPTKAGTCGCAPVPWVPWLDLPPNFYQ